MSGHLDLSTAPFSTLIKINGELSGLRAEYATASPEQRWRAAGFEYYRSAAAELLRGIPLEMGSSPPGTGAIVALAIAPDFAPALLTVGSREYQLDRPDEAMNMFLRLTTFPADTEDLFELIDEAGSFLIGSSDLPRAEALFAAAVEAFPDAADFHASVGYCAGKSGRKQEAVAHARKAAALDASSTVLSDLGWSLIEAGEFDEAREVLERTLAANPENSLARGNLEYLESVVHRASLAGSQEASPHAAG